MDATTQAKKTFFIYMCLYSIQGPRPGCDSLNEAETRSPISCSLLKLRSTNTFFQARSFSKRNAYRAKYAHIHMYVTSISGDRGIENRKDVHSAFLELT